MSADWSSDNNRRTWREPEEARSTHRGIRLPFNVRKTVEGVLLLIAVFVVVPVLWTILHDGGHGDAETIAPSAAATTVTDETATTDSIPSVTETSEAPTPTSEPPTTAAPSVVVPTVPADVPPFADMNGDDFDHISREFLRFVTYLQDHPDPTLVDTIFERDTPAWSHFKNDIEVLAQSPSSGVHQAATVQSVHVVSSSSSRVVVSVITTYGDDHRLNEKLTLVKHFDGTWRVSDHTVTDA